MSDHLIIAPEVQRALAKDPASVVALESTLIAHGLPSARRMDTARGLEDAVRGEGAVPATIAILDGVMHVGLDEAGLRRVCADARKASLRDVSVALATGGVWATTVASTMAIATRAGIRVFATGGIGGVHRGAERSFDESADLVALAKYPVAVVCAGAKAVLDLPRTYERLETLGVPVIGVGTDELPAFYTARSGIVLDHRIDDPGVIATLLKARFDLLGEGGVLIVQPPPADVAQDPESIDVAIDATLAEAERKGIVGNAITPYLLAALDEATSGSAVATNVALVLNNARLAARIACADRMGTTGRS